MFGLFPPGNADGYAYADSLRDSVEIIEAASGVEAYKSCRRVLPSDMTGIVA